jgi:hypothetical protein
MKQIDLDPSEWKREKPSVWSQMRQASRGYEPPPITWRVVLGMVIVMTALYVARHGWPY